jgi:uncharacterized coiled-coil DUF342 family protein
MNLDHLTDSELVQWIIKHDTDPIRVRLATYMDNMPGRILDGLERAGMDPETCLHENIYESGEYIEHLNNEIEYLQSELDDTQEQLRKRETMTVAQLIEELHQEAYQARHQASVACRDRDQMETEVIETRKKMKVWRAISTDIS